MDNPVSENTLISIDISTYVQWYLDIHPLVALEIQCFLFPETWRSDMINPPYVQLIYDYIQNLSSHTIVYKQLYITDDQLVKLAWVIWQLKYYHSWIHKSYISPHGYIVKYPNEILNDEFYFYWDLYMNAANENIICIPPGYNCVPNIEVVSKEITLNNFLRDQRLPGNVYVANKFNENIIYVSGVDIDIDLWKNYLTASIKRTIHIKLYQVYEIIQNIPFGTWTLTARHIVDADLKYDVDLCLTWICNTWDEYQHITNHQVIDNEDDIYLYTLDHCITDEMAAIGILRAVPLSHNGYVIPCISDNKLIICPPFTLVEERQFEAKLSNNFNLPKLVYTDDITPDSSDDESYIPVNRPTQFVNVSTDVDLDELSEVFTQNDQLTTYQINGCLYRDERLYSLWHLYEYMSKTTSVLDPYNRQPIYIDCLTYVRNFLVCRSFIYIPDSCELDILVEIDDIWMKFLLTYGEEYIVFWKFPLSVGEHLCLTSQLVIIQMFSTGALLRNSWHHKNNLWLALSDQILTTLYHMINFPWLSIEDKVKREYVVNILKELI